MDKRALGIQAGYSFGFICLLGAVIYYYASNWGLLERWQQFVPLYTLLIGLFGLSLWLAKRPGRTLMSRLAMLGSCLSFGIGLAVIGQTYHSHADSWLLFAVWTVPAILYAAFTCWQPFGVLAYVLGHIAYLQYFQPDMEALHEEWSVYPIFAGLALIQVLLLAASRLKLIPFTAVRYMAFLALPATLWWMSNSLFFGDKAIVFNTLLIAWLVWSVWSARLRSDRGQLVLTGMAASATAVLKYVEIAVRNWNDFFIIISLLFVIAFVAVHVWWIKSISEKKDAKDQKDAVSGGHSALEEPAAVEPEPKERGRSFTDWLIRVLSASAVAIGTVLGSVSLVAFILVIIDPGYPEYVLAAVGAALYIGAMLAAGWNSIVRYTLMGCGFFIGMTGAGSKEQGWMLAALTLAAIYGVAKEKGLLRRAAHVLAAWISLYAALLMWTHEEDAALLIVGGAMSAVFLICRFRVWKQGEIRGLLHNSSIIGMLIVLFILTFMENGRPNLIYNGLFIAAALLALTLSIRFRITWLNRLAFGLWCSYVAWKYYDTVWLLLHKSISLAVLGLLVMGAVWLWERRWKAKLPVPAETADLIRFRWAAVLLLVLQLFFMSLQIGKSEWLLNRGVTVKLELMPRDPRSMLQGDYVALRYRISEAPIGQSGMIPEHGDKISVALSSNSDGVYEWKRVLTSEEKPGPGEVVIRGKVDYDGIRYGIEHYFVKEGTGLEVERSAKFAEVRVAASGDAILIRLLTE